MKKSVFVLMGIITFLLYSSTYFSVCACEINSAPERITAMDYSNTSENADFDSSYTAELFANEINLSTFNAKLTTFRNNYYDHGSVYKEDDSSSLGYQCFGYANFIARYIFGSFPCADMSCVNLNSNWSRTYGSSAIDNLHVGDVVRYNYHSIFITDIADGYAYYTHANYDHANGVSWEGKKSLSELKTLVSNDLTSGVSGIDSKQYTGWVAHYKGWNDSIIYNVDFYCTDSFTNMPSDVTTTSSSYIIPLQTPYKFGYGFYGWYQTKTQNGSGGTYCYPGNVVDLNNGTFFKATIKEPSTLYGNSVAQIRYQGERYCFKIPISATGHYIFSSSSHLAMASLYDSNGNLIISSSDDNCIIEFDGINSSTYYIYLYNNTANYGNNLPCSLVNDKITFTYDANGGSGAPEAEEKQYWTSSTKMVSISDTAPTRNGYTFCGWSRVINGDVEFLPGDILNPYTLANGNDVTLYAVWEATTIPATGVTISSDTLTLEQGESAVLTATVSPSNATVKSVNWSSSNGNVAHIDENGLITALSPGTSTITVSTVSGGYTDTCLLTVTSYSELIFSYDAICDGTVENQQTATVTENTTFDGKTVVKVVPNPESGISKEINLDGWSMYDKEVNVPEYKYVSFRYYYDSDSPSYSGEMVLNLMGGTMNKRVSHYSLNTVEANKWADIYFKIDYGFDSTTPDIRQIHFKPFGLTKVNQLTANDVLYIENCTFYKNNPLEDTYNSVFYVENLYKATELCYCFTEKINSSVKAANRSTVVYKDGFKTIGWSTTKNSTNVEYEFGEDIELSSDITLYPVIVEDIETYTVSYNANGGTGAPANQTKTENVSLTLSSTKPTRTGYTFKGWATSSTGSVAYAAGASYTANSAVTLYAVWQANTYTVKYNANGGSGSMANSTHTYDESKALSANTFKKSNYTFLGWSLDASGSDVDYTDKQSVMNLTSVNGNTVNLYAVWSSIPMYSITYNANGGTGAPASQSKIQDISVTISSTVPTRTGYTFKGWATTSTGNVAYAPGASYTANADITLYAVWEENAPEVDENDPQIIVNSTKASSGSVVEVTIEIKNNPGIWGLDAYVAYDTSVLTLTEVVNGEVFDDSALTIGPLDLPTYKLSYENTGFENTNTNGVLATLKFTVNEDAEVGTYPITVSYNTGDIINSDEETLVFATVNGEVEIIEFIYGDVNNDGAINKLDSLRLKKYLANLDVEIHPLAADVNADGTVNKLDSLRLKKFLANLDVTLGK